MFTRVQDSIAYLKENKKKFFWYWCLYHIVKGTVTTALIWVPLLYAYLAREEYF